jgi:hypothetical protein
MRAAVLCNGPSRARFQSRSQYEYVIGCNIPWTQVDATVVLDREIVDQYVKQPELLSSKIYFSRQAWQYTDSIRKRNLFESVFAGIIDPKYPFYSSGHGALETIIRNGATDVDIYGCDSWFEYNIDSFTHQYANTSFHNERKCIDEWRIKWKAIIMKHPDVNITFIQ